ncbi:hypothetical protein B0T24DRAFT_136330 [Lasiosphaeria ovina]|uniref:Uncharacterized protein n=1 Tax=Lasiosphaeria ovina TaxID=92902 RepID=A0AAE0KLY3_9PEZI|nr:hypothetical protein B0T24DRAFT_136330 [Lasiosphaeria ovina]
MAEDGSRAGWFACGLMHEPNIPSRKTGKADHPNLGYLLIALLISDIDPTEELMKAIVVETITRNVIWLLEADGQAVRGRRGALPPPRHCVQQRRRRGRGKSYEHEVMCW